VEQQTKQQMCCLNAQQEDAQSSTTVTKAQHDNRHTHGRVWLTCRLSAISKPAQHSSAHDSTAQQLMQASNELSTTSQAVRPQHLLGKGQVFGRRSLGLHELVAPCCQLLMEDPVSQPMAVCQSVCEPSTAAHHLFNCAAVEGQQLTDFEAEHQGQVGCQHLLYADLQHR